jgi:hypothetical protein
MAASPTLLGLLGREMLLARHGSLLSWFILSCGNEDIFIFFDKSQGRGIDVVAFVSWRRPVIENVPRMRITPCAEHLDPLYG